MENSTLSVDNTPSNTNSTITDDIIRSSGHFKSFAQEVTEQIEMYLFYCIAPVGIIFNTNCVIIFVIIKNYKTSTGLHLICIAIADILVFISMFLRRKRTWSRFVIYL